MQWNPICLQFTGCVLPRSEDLESAFSKHCTARISATLCTCFYGKQASHSQTTAGDYIWKQPSKIQSDNDSASIQRVGRVCVDVLYYVEPTWSDVCFQLSHSPLCQTTMSAAKILVCLHFKPTKKWLITYLILKVVWFLDSASVQ